jgi:DNA transformation protein
MSELARHMVDVFQSFGPVELRRMFAGYGIFRDGTMFALVYDESLYLKVDAENVADFQNRGLTQFRYSRKGKIVHLSYYQAPESVMDDCDEAACWGYRSFAAALRAKASRTRQ